MADEVSWVIQVAVKNGELDNLRSLMADMVSSTKDESGALGYEWFIDEAEGKLAIYERYSDSAATMVHLGNFGANFAERFLACVDPVSLQVFGTPSDEVKGVLDGFGATYFGPFGGFFR
ncbi:MAG TPA: antibiotic biosynthesis monooxygenase [Acidimicrobiales bacterium]|nr:antibiotic biosynthesis monooxygenase [Acidimicrobiales bacterium]